MEKEKTKTSRMKMPVCSVRSGENVYEMKEMKEMRMLFVRTEHSQDKTITKMCDRYGTV